MLDGSDGAVRSVLVAATLMALLLGVCYGIWGKATPGSNAPGPLTDYLTFSLPWLAALWGGAGVYIAPRSAPNAKPDVEKSSAWCFIVAFACLVAAYLAYVAGHDLEGVAWLWVLGTMALVCTTGLGYRAWKRKSEYAVPAAMFATILVLCTVVASCNEMKRQRTPQANATSAEPTATTGRM